jgi:TonB family protein
VKAVLLLALLLGACRAAPERSAAPPRTEPGEEPLETASFPEDEVVPIELERSPAATEGRPCAWARAWKDPNAPKPLLAGVGGVPNPSRVTEAAISLPVREPAPSGSIVVEIVVAPDGSVTEAKVVRSTDPPWPEAEERILESVGRWRYEPSSFEGTPIAVCTTVTIKP